GDFGLQVMMSTTDTDPDSFTEIEPLFIFENTDYVTKYVNIEADGPVYIAFHVPSDYDGEPSTLNLDDVKIVDGPLCPSPSNFTVDEVTEDSAEFSWDAGFEEESWEIVIQPAGVGIPTESGDIVTETEYTATDLNMATQYQAFVRANCGSDSHSEWVGPLDFMTTCETYDTPFHETFNSDSDTEGCWTLLDANNDGNKWNTDIAIFPYEGDQSAGMFTGTNGANNDWLITPGLNIQDNQRLRFYYRAGSQ